MFKYAIVTLLPFGLLLIHKDAPQQQSDSHAKQSPPVAGKLDSAFVEPGQSISVSAHGDELKFTWLDFKDNTIRTKSMKLFAGKAIRRITFSSRGSQSVRGKDWVPFGLVLEFSLKNDEMFEYVAGYGRLPVDHNGEPQFDSLYLSFWPILETTESPFELMSVSQPIGDALLVTFQDIK